MVKGVEIMDKSDKMILKAFCYTKVPTDFYNTVDKIIALDTIFGFANRAINGVCIKKEEILRGDFSLEENKNFEIISSKSLENKRFYFLLKLVILILSRYAT